jgi:hypothetical protein
MGNEDGECAGTGICDGVWFWRTKKILRIKKIYMIH